MKPLHAIAYLLLSLAVVSHADPVPAPDQQIIPALKELQAQQAQIADNQAKIEARLASIAEAVRVARIYSSRGGH